MTADYFGDPVLSTWNFEIMNCRRTEKALDTIQDCSTPSSVCKKKKIENVSKLQ